ncbi:UNVERIFIED_CONTAM: hypothetical protein DES50_12125 [Williamsia faeni]
MPNSLLWVCLVAIWLFVLVPMVVKSRPTVRKTSDAALSTRVLHRGGRNIAKTKRRMASGRHPHDAEWEPPVREYRKVVATGGTATAVKEADVDVDEVDDVDVVDAETTDAPEADKTPVMKKVAVEADSATDDIDDSDESEVEGDSDTDIEAEADDKADVEVVDDADDLEDAESDDDDAVAESEDELDEESDDAELEDAEYDDDLEDDDYEDDAEYDDLEADADEDDADEEVAEDNSARRIRRGGFDPEAERERSDKRYRFRQRVMALLGVLALLSVGAGVLLGTVGWIATAVLVVGLLGYMFFLRRAVRNEQRIFQQRMRRLARARREEEERRAHPEVDPRADIPARLRRPGAIVLEIDDEDPIFDHLPSYEHAARIDDIDREHSYRRVVGQ